MIFPMPMTINVVAMTDIIQFCIRFLMGYVLLFALIVVLLRLFIPFRTAAELKKRDIIYNQRKEI